MTRTRVAAALAAIVTALLLQGALVGPLTAPLPVSLPALVVAAVALADGPGAGMAFGFSCGLVADLASSTHPAGVLALSWLAVGVLCGLGADNTSVRLDAATAAGVCTALSLITAVCFVVLDAAGATLADAVRSLVPTVLVNALLALGIVPLVRRFLDNPSLRAVRVAPPLVVQGR